MATINYSLGGSKKERKDMVMHQQLELIEHIPRVPWCIAELCSIEHAQDSLVQACAVVSIGVATMGNK
jgi:hypothetical protein